MRKIIFCTVAICIMVVLNSCGQNEKQNSFHSKGIFLHYENAQTLESMEDQPAKQEFTVVEHEIDQLGDYTTGCITAMGEKIYYEKSLPKYMSNTDIETKIYEYDLESEKEKLVYKISDKNGFELNELLASNKSLFWVVARNGEREIQKYDLATSKLKNIKTISNDIGPILLATDGDFLTWYETASENTTLYVYNISNNQINSISDNINNTSMFNRALINHGVTVFTTLQGDKNIIHVFDLKSMTSLYEFQSNKPVVFPIANDKYLVWSVKKGENILEEIYAYDLHNNRLTKVNLDNISVFSFDLADNVIYLNDTITGEIWGENIEKQSETNITGNLGEKHLFHLGRAIENKNFIVIHNNFEEETAKIVYIKRLM